MAPSPAKRVTRSANAKTSRQRASRKATPTDSGYGGSEESWRSSNQNSNKEMDISEDPLVQPKGAQTQTLTAQGISPSKSKRVTQQQKLVTNTRSTRRPSIRNTPSKKYDTVDSIFDNDPAITIGPVDTHPHSKSSAERQDSHSEHQADPEMERALKYFSKPKNRSNQPALETFFNSQPEHPQTDAVYKHRYHILRSAAWNWATEYFSDIPATSPPLNLMHLVENHLELMEYINATTSSPHSEVWEQILQLKRAEIVYSILGKVLEMHVFGREFFGATPEEEQSMREQDFAMRDSDGFCRHLARSNLITSFLPQHNHLPASYLPSLQTLLRQIYTLLHPLLPAPDPVSASLHPHHHSNFSTTLFTILLLATKLHLDIRRHPNTIYYFPPSPSPASTYDAEDMNVVNHETMEKRIAEPLTRSALRVGKMRRVVGVGGWPGLVGYEAITGGPRRRQHGNSSNLSNNQGEDSEVEGGKRQSGILTQTLARADVFIEFEAVAPKAGGGRVLGNRGQRKSLRTEMRERVLRMEEKVKKGRVLKRAGVATAVALGVGQGIKMWLGQ